MCLYVDSDRHCRKGGKTRRAFRRPRTVTSPILVYKVLKRVGGSEYAISPYRNFRWIFGKEHTAKFSHDLDNYYDEHNIDEGLHAFRNRQKANDLKSCGYGRRVYYAVIPVGAKVYMGCNDDIVSTKMTVYASLDDLQAVHGKVSTTPIDYRKLTKGN